MMRQNIKRGFFALILTIVAIFAPLMWTDSAFAQATEVRYVDDNASPGGNGQTWSAAFKHLQDALAAAQQIVNTNNPPGVLVQLRIAQGTYKPDQGTGYTAGNRNHSFVMVKRTRIIGGYAGPGTADPDANDPSLYPTILSGDIDNDGILDAQNSYTVVKASDSSMVPETTRLERVTITGGYANGGGNDNKGAGVRITAGWPRQRGPGEFADSAFSILTRPSHVVR